MTLVIRSSGNERFLAFAERVDLSPKAQSRALAGFAREGIGEARAHNHRILGSPPRLTVRVDGREGVPLESVRPTGRIEAEFELLDEALRWIAQTLVDRSPVVSGNYIRAHKIYADEREIHVEAGQPVPLARQYILLNAQPYARRLEVGRRADGRPFVVQVPPRIYERTAVDAARRFGNLAAIRFGYRAPMGGALMAYVPIGRGKTRPLPDASTRAAAGVERARRVPAIIVTRRG